MADTLPADLSKVDPADAWKPYTPSPAVPWNRKWVTHLYRRAAFGASPAEAEQAIKDGPAKTIERLMSGHPDAAELLEVFTDAGESLKEIAQFRAWWLWGMQESGHPLREKLALFWHNHFATSNAKVLNARLMFEQNVTIRKHALGRFRPFLLDMSKDTAMLVWLDSNQNRKGAPNENYAREVMELFSLGVGHYTEKDIQEAARALTGWHHSGGWDYNPRVAADTLTFEYHPAEHDDGPKTIFGKTGNWGGEDVARLCCDNKWCAPFLTGKLYAYLVSETPPPEPLLAPLVEQFRNSDYDIAGLVKAMIGSRLFFSEHTYRKRVKWPVEYALGAVRSVVPDRAPLGDLLDPLAKMGQVLFAPPNVKGWRTGTDWLNSATLLARNNFAESVAMGNWARLSLSAPRSKAAFATAAKPTTPPPAPAVAIEYPADPATAVVGGAAAYSVPLEGPEGKPILVLPPMDAPPVPGGPGQPQPPGVIGPATNQAPTPDSKLDVIPLLFATQPKTPAELVNRMAELLYGTNISPAAQAKIEKFLLTPGPSVPKTPSGPPTPAPPPKGGTVKSVSVADPVPSAPEKATEPAPAAAKPKPGVLDMTSDDFKARAREALHALMCLPEYQLG